jgi:DNA-binding MarR family transcriptional regulator
MTNCAPPAYAEDKQLVADLMAAHGIHDLRGLELLRLVRTVNGAYDHVLAEAAVATPLTHHRWRVLFRIWMEEQLGCPAVHPTQLSRAQQVSKNTISDHLRALEDAGLIMRTLDEADRRQFKIQLTPAGRDLAQRSMPDHIQLLNRLAAGLNDDERSQLMVLLAKLQLTIFAHGSTGAAPPLLQANREE